MNRSKARGLRRQPWSCARINACFLIARGIFKKKEERERERRGELHSARARKENYVLSSAATHLLHGNACL